jgi:hypothetical protein
MRFRFEFLEEVPVHMSLHDTGCTSAYSLSGQRVGRSSHEVLYPLVRVVSLNGDIFYKTECMYRLLYRKYNLFLRGTLGPHMKIALQLRNYGIS